MFARNLMNGENARGQAGADASVGGSSGLASDPLTGGGRYVPRGAAAPTAGVGGGGGASTAMGVDPLTGAGAYRSGSSATGGTAGGFFPKRDHSVFEAGNFAAMKKKLNEFNELLNQSSQGLSEVNMNQLNSTIATVTNDPSGSPHIFSNQAAVAFSLLEWPQDQILPVLDLLRLVVLRKDGVKALVGSPDGEEHVKKVIAQAAAANKAPVRMLAVRFICNLFPSPAKAFAYKHADTILKYLDDISPASATQKNLRVAHSALLLNYAIEMGGQPDSAVDIEVRTTIVGQLIKCFAAETEDTILSNLMLAIGTMVCNNAMLKEALKTETAFVQRMDTVPNSNPNLSTTWLHLNALFQ